MTDHPFAAPSRRDLFKVGVVGLGAVGGAAFFPTIANAESGEAAAVIPSEPNHDYFLKLQGIAGDSSDDLFSGQLQPIAFSWGVNNSASIGGGGSGTGKATALPFIFITPVSSASPPLMLACATGRHISFAILTVLQPAAVRRKVMTLRFDNTIVTRYQQSSGDTDGKPVDVVNLGYAKVTYSFFPQRLDGSTGTPVVTAFNFLTQSPG